MTVKLEIKRSFTDLNIKNSETEKSKHMFYRVAEGFTWHSDVRKKHRFFIFPNNFSFFLTMARKEKKKERKAYFHLSISLQPNH